MAGVLSYPSRAAHLQYVFLFEAWPWLPGHKGVKIIHSEDGMQFELGSVFRYPFLPCPSHVQELGMQREIHVQSCWLFPSLVCSLHPLQFSQQWQSGAITLPWDSSDPEARLLERPWSTAAIWQRDRDNYQIFLVFTEMTNTPFMKHFAQYLMNLLASTTKSWRCVLFSIFPLILLILKGVKWLIFLDVQSFLAEKIGNERITFCPSKFSLNSVYKLNLSSKNIPNSYLWQLEEASSAKGKRTHTAEPYTN